MEPSQFHLTDELAGHEAPVRCVLHLPNDRIVTGAQDNTAKIWERKEGEDGLFYENIITLKEHTRWVTAVSCFSENLIDESSEGGIVTGCLDKVIRFYNDNGRLIKSLKGHEGGIISFSWVLPQGQNLISGSWDGTAKIWDIRNDFACICTLSGHENGVTVLSLINGTIITASTGRQEQGKVVDAQIRLWNFDGSLIKRLTNHDGPVRDLQILEGVGFISTSNDGSGRLWSGDGVMLGVMNHPMGNEGHPSFVLSGCTLANGECVTGDEAGRCLIWRDCQAIQTIRHPSTIWAVRPLPNGDFLTACQDHKARIFSRDQSKKAHKDVIAAFQEAVKEKQASHSKGPTKEEIDKLPNWELNAYYQGKSEGQVQLFNKNGKPIAAQWSESSKTWIEVGEVTGSGDGGQLDGNIYDHIFPIEIENTDGSVRNLKIGYNNGENPYSAAQLFIDKYMLPQDYLTQVADYITQRAGKSVPVIGGAEVGQNSGGGFNGVGDPTGFSNSVSSGHNSEKLGKKYFPVDSYIVFEAGDIEKIQNKIFEFDGKMEGGLKMEENERKSLCELCDTLKITNRYHSTKVTAKQLNTLLKLRNWPEEMVFPVLDLARLAVLHPHASELIGQTDSSDQFFLFVSSCCQKNSPNSSILCGLRFLANSLKAKPTRKLVVGRIGCFLDAVSASYTNLSANKPLRATFSVFLLNLSLALKEFPCEFEKDSVEKFVELLYKILSLVGDIEDDVVFRCLVAVGTLLCSNNEAAKSFALAKERKVIVDSIVQLKRTPALSECAAEVRKFF